MKYLLFVFILHNVYHLLQANNDCTAWHDASHIDVFEFGVNAGSVVFNVLGQMGRWDKILRVPIDIAPCRKLAFVHAETRNSDGPPAVSVDWDMNTVVIKYRSNQYSISCYTIIAKTVNIPNCVY